jgi:alkanesulfonate monooxygenase SsuD/methylene tetrahydromethanopterin reductase-like flavin-dependent oxidoreductase (luciferase family)
MDRLGKDRNPFRAGFLQFVGVAETHKEALEMYREPAEYFFNRCLHVDARWANPAGYSSEATIRARVASQVVAAATKATDAVAYGPPTFEEIVEKGYVIIGSPDEVAEKLREVAVNMNVGQLMLLLQYGNMNKELAFHNTELFAKRVAPQLKGLFEDKWEDRWWPKPMPREERANPRPVVVR